MQCEGNESSKSDWEVSHLVRLEWIPMFHSCSCAWAWAWQEGGRDGVGINALAAQNCD